MEGGGGGSNPPWPPPGEEEQQAWGRRRRRALVLVAGSALLLVTAGVVAGLLGSRDRARHGRTTGPPRSPPFESTEIIDALMVANQVRPSGGSVEAAAAAEASSAPPTTVVSTAAPSTQPSSTTANTGSPFTGLIKDLFAATADRGAGGLAQQPTVDGIPAGAVITPAWARLREGAKEAVATSVGGGSGRGVICYPENGREVEEMVGASHPCNVLVLRKGPDEEYTITRTLNVSTPKVLIGNPISMPVLNCSGSIERLWDIQAGGRLDARFVTMVRGFGRRARQDRSLRLTVATIAIIRVGGYFTASGCLFRERPNTAASWRREIQSTISDPRTRTRTLGGLFLVLGGNIRFTGCRFFRLRPYGMGTFNNMTVGRDILVVAGNGVLVGCIFYAFNLYVPNLWISGNAIVVLGGTGLFVGGAMYAATGAQLQVGYGCQILTAGGLMITIGWGFAATTLALARSNGGQFSVGAGGLIMVGYHQGRAWGVGAVYGAGQTFVCGSGFYYKIISGFASFALSTVFSGVGGITWVGSGSLKYIHVTRTSNSLTAATYGAGGALFNAGGGVSAIFYEQFATNIARWVAGAGSDWFLGGGWATSVNSTRSTYALVNAFRGVGSQIFIGLGGAVFIRSHTYAARMWNWNTSPYTYTVAGMGTRLTRGQNIFLSKKGLTQYVYNKTDKTITKKFTPKPPKTQAPTSVPGSSGQHGKRRRLPVAGRKRTGRRFMEAADPADTARLSWLADALACTNASPFDLPNKVVVLQSTLVDVQAALPETRQGQGTGTAESNDQQWGGYAKRLADGLMTGSRQQQPPPPTAATPVAFLPGKVSANNSACFLCQVGPGATSEHVGGPGACEVDDRCDGAGPLDVQAEAQRHTAQDLSFPQQQAAAGAGAAGGGASLPYRDEEGRLQSADVALLWHEVTVYCTTTTTTATPPSSSSPPGGCLDRATLKAAVQAYMGADVSSMVDVAVSAAGVHRAVASVVQDLDAAGELADALAPAWDPECQGSGATFNVYVITTAPEAAAAAQELWAGVVADPADFSDTVVAVASASSSSSSMGNATDAADAATAPGEGPRPCRVTVSRKASVTYPAIDKMPAYRPSAHLSLAPALTIGSATAIVPVESVVAGRTYTLFVQNFPHSSPVTIVLRDAQGSSALPGPGPEGIEEAGGPGVVVAAIDAFDDDGGDGIMEVAWTVPTDTPAGRYYLLAYPTTAPALFATSAVFALVSAAEGDGDDHEEHLGQRRRLSVF